MSYIEYVTGGREADEVLTDLAEANNFTLADLEENRAGRISGPQRQRLYARALAPLRYTGGALLGWLIACGIVKVLVPDIVLTVLALLGAKTFLVVFWGITLPCVLAFLASAVKSVRLVTLLQGDLRDGKAAHIEGRITTSREDVDGLGLEKFHQQKNTQRAYVFQDWRFDVDEDAMKALRPGLRYRLYYAPQSTLLLSIEPAPANR
ncbi:MAG: hypothetical protein SFV54_14760 [Bryobacteraceae bacterium]|nr:hypothetical protein [Bryobacteraceae bacterium]